LAHNEMVRYCHKLVGASSCYALYTCNRALMDALHHRWSGGLDLSWACVYSALIK